MDHRGGAWTPHAGETRGDKLSVLWPGRIGRGRLYLVPLHLTLMPTSASWRRPRQPCQSAPASRLHSVIQGFSSRTCRASCSVPKLPPTADLDLPARWAVLRYSLTGPPRFLLPTLVRPVAVTVPFVLSHGAAEMPSPKLSTWSQGLTVQGSHEPPGEGVRPRRPDRALITCMPFPAETSLNAMVRRRIRGALLPKMAIGKSGTWPSSGRRPGRTRPPRCRDGRSRGREAGRRALRGDRTAAGADVVI
jgi:hypothetical protein